jgi:hypothetical protein
LIDGSYERVITAYSCVTHSEIGACLEVRELGPAFVDFMKAEVGHGKDYRDFSSDWNIGTIERVTENASMAGKSGILVYITQNP